MVNKGRIHKELGKFLMISSNLIKSDDESMIEIGQMDILWKRTWRRICGIKNQWIWLWFRREIEDWIEEIFFEKYKERKAKIKREINSNDESKLKLNAKRR